MRRRVKPMLPAPITATLMGILGDLFVFWVVGAFGSVFFRAYPWPSVIQQLGGKTELSRYIFRKIWKCVEVADFGEVHVGVGCEV